jgi:putative SOS response-associated peptidase YedK
MCGRFAIDGDPEELQLYFELERTPLFPPRYNVCPGTKIAVIGKTLQGVRALHFLHWGFVPAWARDESEARGLHNARSETVHEKASFAGAFRRRRCLVPATGFYEWARGEGGRQPYYVRPKGESSLFAMAGIWQPWMTGEGQRQVGCAILTRAASGAFAGIHHRMPVVLPRDCFAAWVEPEDAEPAALRGVLDQAVPAEGFEFWPVSKDVNRAESEGPELTQPCDPGDSPGSTPGASELGSLFD